MPSKTSSFKNIVHVAANDLRHAWFIWFTFTLPLILFLFLSIDEYSRPHFWWSSTNQIIVACHLVYALAVALYLFWHLFSSRSAVAVHALPLTRPQLYLGHLAAAFVMELIPLAASIAVPMAVFARNSLSCEQYLPQYLLAAGCSWLWFFGFAVFWAMLCGSAVGMCITYALFNFLCPCVILAVEALCSSFLYGFNSSSQIETLAVRLCPALNMLTADNSTWFPVYGGLGLLLLAAALVLYLRRPLECAGDMLAFPVCNTAFCVLAGLSGFLISSFLFNADLLPLSFAMGTVCYLLAYLLIYRSFNILRKAALLPYAGTIALLAAGLFCLKADVFGYTAYVPDSKDIQSVSLEWVKVNSEEKNINLQFDTLTLTDPAQIQSIQACHKTIVENYLSGAKSGGSGLYFPFKYTLKNGAEVERAFFNFDASVSSEFSTHLSGISFSPTFLTEWVMEQDKHVDRSALVSYLELPNNSYELDHEETNLLLKALQQDLAGTELHASVDGTISWEGDTMHLYYHPLGFSMELSLTESEFPHLYDQMEKMQLSF